jgi:hypothetical protein
MRQDDVTAAFRGSPMKRVMPRGLERDAAVTAEPTGSDRPRQQVGGTSG